MISGVLILAIFKDITSEKKQQILLEEEKVHSEKLLKNILPEQVAYRLKVWIYCNVTELLFRKERHL